MKLSGAWEEHAQDWIGWAPTLDHDGFWDGTWSDPGPFCRRLEESLSSSGVGKGAWAASLKSLDTQSSAWSGWRPSPALLDERGALDSHPGRRSPLAHRRRRGQHGRRLHVAP